MKMEKRQTILEGEVKVLKDTVWRLTTRVYGLEEQIKEMKTKLKITTTVDTRLVDLQQIPETIALVGRTKTVRSTSKTLVSTPSSSSIKYSQKPKAKEKQSKTNISKTPEPGPKSKTRYKKLTDVAVKKTAAVSATKTPRRLEHQSVITKRGRRATSFKLQPSDEEKEVYCVSDSSDEAEKPKKQTTVKQKRVFTPVKNTTKSTQEDLAMLAKRELDSFNRNNSDMFDAHEDLIMFPNNSNLNTDYASSVTIHLVGNDDSDQLPLKKRRLDASAEYDSSAIVLNLPNTVSSNGNDARIEDELCDPVAEGFTSYVHKPPDTFNCFFCGQEFSTDAERVIHTKIHAGNKIT